MTINRSRRSSRRISRRRVSKRTTRRNIKRRTTRRKRRTTRRKRRTNRSKRKQKGGVALAIAGMGQGTSVGDAHLEQLNWSAYLTTFQQKISNSLIHHPSELLHHARKHHDFHPQNNNCTVCRSLLTRLVSDTQTNRDHFSYDDILFVSDMIHANKKRKVFDPSDISFLYDQLALATHYIHEKGDIKHHDKQLALQNALIGGTLVATGISFVDKGFTKKLITRWNTHRVADKSAKHLQSVVNDKKMVDTRSNRDYV